MENPKAALPREMEMESTMFRPLAQHRLSARLHSHACPNAFISKQSTASLVQRPPPPAPWEVKRERQGKAGKGREKRHSSPHTGAHKTRPSLPLSTPFLHLPSSPPEQTLAFFRRWKKGPRGSHSTASPCFPLAGPLKQLLF